MLDEAFIEPGVKIVWFYGGDIANQPQVVKSVIDGRILQTREQINTEHWPM